MTKKRRQNFWHFLFPKNLSIASKIHQIIKPKTELRLSHLTGRKSSQNSRVFLTFTTASPRQRLPKVKTFLRKLLKTPWKKSLSSKDELSTLIVAKTLR